MLDSVQANATETFCKDVDTQCQQTPYLVRGEGRPHPSSVGTNQALLQISGGGGGGGGG